MALHDRIKSLAEAVGADMKSVQTSVANLTGQVEALSNIQGGGVGAGGTQQVFIQSTQPADTGQPYIWIQTSLSNGGWRVWYNETGTT